MSKEEAQTETMPTNPQRQTWIANEHPSYYANIMQVGLTPFDLSMIFGSVTGATPEEVICVPLAKVTLAPEQIANLIQMLATGLQQYVNQFGALRDSAAFKIGQTAPIEGNTQGVDQD